MGKLKRKIAAAIKEAGETFRGVSKGAMAVALWTETLLLLIAVMVALLCSLRLAVGDSMTQQALRLREITITERDSLEEQKDSYKKLYEATLKDYEEYKDANPSQSK